MNVPKPHATLFLCQEDKSGIQVRNKYANITQWAVILITRGGLDHVGRNTDFRALTFGCLGGDSEGLPSNYIA